MTSRPSIAFAKFAAPKEGQRLRAVGGRWRAERRGKGLRSGKTLERAFPVAEFSGKFASLGRSAGAGRDVARPAGGGRRRQGRRPRRLCLAEAWRHHCRVVAQGDRRGRRRSTCRALPSAAGKRQASPPASCCAAIPSTSTRPRRTTATASRADRKPVKFTIHTADPAAAKKAFADDEAVIDGVFWRAIWSTNRPTCSGRSNSPPAPRNWKRSASRSRS